MSYDVIGDIHGQGTKLRMLLRKLGYEERSGTFRQINRSVIFLGDFIDRGPEQLKVLNIVRRMVDSGSAQAVMGNHEFNAIGWVSPNPEAPGQFLRQHTDAHRRQHGAFLSQIGEGSPAHREAVAWFRALPLYLDLGCIRAVHAWWQPDNIERVSQMTATESAREAFYQSAFTDGTPEFLAAEGALKGLEADLPPGQHVVDDSGISRSKVRVKWWKRDAATLGDLALMLPGRSAEALREFPAPGHLPLGLDGEAPVFIGHYWFSGVPTPIAPNLACLDYSVGRNGPLVAYQWEGERILSAAQFICQH